MIKLINIQANGSSIRVDALIEGEKDNSFEIVFDKNGEILSSTANEKQNYYKAQARITTCLWQEKYTVLSRKQLGSLRWRRK